MVEFTFNFCPKSRIAETIAPDEPEIKDFNGWDYTPNPVLPYRRRFKVTLYGLRWRFNDNGTIDYATVPETNAGVLEAFYMGHRKHKPFNFVHEWMGNMEMRFSSPVSVPKSMPDSGGLIDALEIDMMHHNPSY